MENLKRLLECPTCFERITPPVMKMCKNGHAVCSICSVHLSHCPVCRDLFCSCRHTFIDQILEEIPMPCKYKRYGCEKTKPVKSITEHEKHCDYKLVKCNKCFVKQACYAFSDHLYTRHTIHNVFNFGEKLMRSVAAPYEFYEIYCYEKTFKMVFSPRYFVDIRKKTLVIYVVYFGRKKDEKKYLYQIQLEQGHHLNFTFGGYCVPFFEDEDFRKHSKLLSLDVNKIFLGRELPVTLSFSYTILRSGLKK